MEAKFRCLGDGTCLDPGFTLQELADTSFDPPGTTPSLPATTTDDSGFEEYENENNVRVNLAVLLRQIMTS